MSPDAILGRQLERAYRQFTTVVLANVGASIFFAAVVGYEIGSDAAAAWLALTAVGALMRFVFFRRFESGPDQLAMVGIRHREFLAGSFICGLLWAMAALSCFFVDGVCREFVLVAISGVAIIGTVWHALVPRASLLFILPIAAVLLTAVIRNADETHTMTVVAAVLMVAVMAAIVRRLERLATERCVESVRNQELAQGLEAAFSHLMDEIGRREAADEGTAACSRKLDLLIEQTALATVELDKDGLVTKWNPAAVAMFGYAAAEVVGQRKFFDLVFAEDERSETMALWREQLAKGEGFQTSSRNRTRDGRALVCSWAVTPLGVAADGCCGGVIAQARDTTARSEAFHALEESRRQLEEAQRLAHVGHWEWNYAEDHATFSREALRIFGRPDGWSPSAAEVNALVADGEGRHILARVRLAGLQGLDEFSVEHRVGDGNDLRIVHTRVRVEFNVDGSPRRFIAATQDVTEMRSYQQQLHSLAFFDRLTELPNRALFGDRLAQSIAEAAWHKDLMGVMVIDLDRFKAVNDALGHVVGDSLLREAAGRLTTCVRGYDTVARLGGDEFAILLPEIRDGADLGGIARKIVDAFALPFRLGDTATELFVSCSIGVVVFPNDGTDATELLRNADAAMYHAKNCGRNNFQFYSAELTARSAERLGLDAQLRQAEKNGELELYYQPKIDLATGALIGAEALLRWNNPSQGLLTPDRFIGIAEDTGLIVGIGEWVLREACRQACRWNAGRENDPISIAVNLSVRQFHMNDLVGSITSILEETGCRPEWLECEITESLLLNDSDDIRNKLFAIHGLGIPLAIDDFGTGYSSLGYLNRYPVKTIKIDRSFVCHTTRDRDAAELVKAIISMGRCLRLEVVAEGVETVEQQSFLQAHGCDIGQGWLYGKAMPQSQFEGLLAGSLSRSDRAASPSPTFNETMAGLSCATS